MCAYSTNTGGHADCSKSCHGKYSAGLFEGVGTALKARDEVADHGTTYDAR